MKKLNFLTKFLVACFLAFCAFGFVACGDDDDNSDETLSYPSGSLTDRGGETVSQANLNEFFATLEEEIYGSGNSYDGSSYESTEDFDWGFRESGSKSGYYDWRQISYTEKKTADGESISDKFTQEYHNYSNTDVLYLGGGMATQYNENYKETATSYEYVAEITINGKINLTGKYKTTIDFQNFKFKQDSKSDRDTHIGGKIILGTLDITNRFEDLLDTGVWEDG
ncbi:MAG: hypothetical protein FWF51_10075 [Chitinivibrionia bacterium]|nr:hypothetical protein [Chitinivibrionia bacterium]